MSSSSGSTSINNSESVEPSSSALTALLTFSLITIVLAVVALYWILCRIELHKTLSLPDKLELEEHDEDEEDHEHNEEKKNDDMDDAASRRNNNNNNKKSNSPSKQKNHRSSSMNGNDGSDSNVIRRRKLDNFTKIIILGTCIVLTLLTWLLLVRSNANVIISWLGMSCITIVLLKSYIVEEVTGGNGRMRRVDRLSAIVTILLFLTMALYLQSYANTQVAQGVIYAGPARIVGYDSGSYEADAADGSTGGRGQQNANQEVAVTRTDLQVAWGGAWGCPNHVTTQCQALVQGALCEADTPEARKKILRHLEQHSSSNSISLRTDPKRRSTRRGRRRLGGDDNNNAEEQKADDTDNNDVEAKETEIQEEEEQVVEAEEQVQEEEEVVDEEKEQVKEEEEQVQQEKESAEEEEEYVDEEYEEVVEDYYYVEGEQAVVEEEEAEDREEVKEEDEELVEEEEENEELEEENEELEEEVEEYIEYTAELEEGYQYYYDDDVYEDSYWDEQDWDSVWGEYACADLFDSDVSGQVYNSNTPPGSDSWPFVNIYGNCQTCEAFLVDYYSTQHFQEIVQYKVSGRNYGLAALISLCLTILLHIKFLVSPKAEKEIELLSRHGMVRGDFTRGTMA